MAVIDRRLAGIDYIFGSDGLRIVLPSEPGHETPARNRKHQPPRRHARYSPIATAGSRMSRAVSRDILSSR